MKTKIIIILLAILFSVNLSPLMAQVPGKKDLMKILNLRCSASEILHANS